MYKLANDEVVKTFRENINEIYEDRTNNKEPKNLEQKWQDLKAARIMQHKYKTNIMVEQKNQDGRENEGNYREELNKSLKKSNRKRKIWN